MEMKMTSNDLDYFQIFSNLYQELTGKPDDDVNQRVALWYNFMLLNYPNEELFFMMNVDEQPISSYYEVKFLTKYPVIKNFIIELFSFKTKKAISKFYSNKINFERHERYLLKIIYRHFEKFQVADGLETNVLSN